MPTHFDQRSKLILVNNGVAYEFNGIPEITITSSDDEEPVFDFRSYGGFTTTLSNETTGALLKAMALLPKSNNWRRMHGLQARRKSNVRH